MFNTSNDLPSKPKRAFDLPKIHCREVAQRDWKMVYEDWSNSNHSFTFYRTSNNEFKCLFTEMGEEEFLMLCILLNRHTNVFNLFKLVIMDIEKMRETPCVDHDFTHKALEYIRLKKLNNPNLELK